MKKVLLVWGVCLLFINTYAQDSKEVIKKFNEYFEVLLKKDFDKSLDYVHEGIFEIAPRDQMKAILEQTFSNPMMDVEMSMPEVKGVSATKKVGDTHYVKFNAKNTIKMRFNLPETGGPGLDQIKQGLVGQFGEENVSFDNDTKFFTITSVKPVIANSTDKKTWKFTTIDNDQLIPMLEKFIPKEILDMKVD